ncbi:hypothetical protein [Piscinibacter sp.]|uniref:hypothetical protein n=1 Tax=Piscinibacter sp. TaxID=1903157 RepID=UPI002D00D817|nr:hypothetical protein [Albitalea sp.]HUG24196.1 hypothetical protein [Albitalea sp.]
MNKLPVPLFAASALLASLSAQAGPDWAAIEHARQAKHAPPLPGDGEALANAGRLCGAPAPLPWLDHGPRAQGTPQQNRARQARHEAERKSCEGAAQ